MLGARVEVLHDRRERERHDRHGLDRVVAHAREIERAAGELRVPLEARTQVAEAVVQIARADQREVFHGIAQVCELPVGDRLHARARVDEVSRTRIALDEHGLGHVLGRIAPQPVTREREQRNGLAHRTLVGRLPDPQVVEREGLGRLRPGEADRLEALRSQGMRSRQQLHEVVCYRVALHRIGDLVEVVGSLDELHGDRRRIGAEGEHRRHRMAGAVQRIDQPRLAPGRVDARVLERRVARAAHVAAQRASAHVEIDEPGGAAAGVAVLAARRGDPARRARARARETAVPSSDCSSELRDQALGVALHRLALAHQRRPGLAQERERHVDQRAHAQVFEPAALV